MKRLASIALVATVLLAGCEGFKEAMTAHVDTVARAGSQELSVSRLAQMMGTTPEVPISNETARAIAEVWVNYQLLAQAAARNDSLNDPKKIDEAMWMPISQAKTGKLIDSLSKTWVGDTNVTEATYAQGTLLSAQHILLRTPEGATPTQIDSVRRKAEGIRAQAQANPSAANFGALAAKHSEDPGSKDRGGLYAVFPRAPAQGAMVEEFEKGVAALQPGQIGPLVQTTYGFHIIRRPLLPEVKSEFGRAYSQVGAAAAESTYLAKLEKDAKVDVKAKAPEVLRAVAKDLEAHRDDRTVVATSTAGSLPASRVAQFIRAIPQPNQAQIRQAIAQYPDSMLTQFIRRMVQQDVLLKMADDAKMGPDSAELGQMRTAFNQWVQGAWQQLRVAPAMLADSAKSQGDRERVAAGRVEQYMNGLLTGQAQFIQIPEPLEDMLKEKYDSKIVDAGIDRAVEQAQAIRAQADSARANQPRPPSAVPMPGQPPAGAPPAGGPPSGAPPAGNPPPSGR
jgi:peptidyl-prolyl cis-trans isomerase D